MAVNWSSTSSTWPSKRGKEVGSNPCELEAVAANNAQLVAQGNVAFEQRKRGPRQTVREEFDGYCAHIAVEMQEDIPAHVEAGIAEVRDFFRCAL